MVFVKPLTTSAKSIFEWTQSHVSQNTRPLSPSAQYTPPFSSPTGVSEDRK
jgi:hypothetical protein